MLMSRIHITIIMSLLVNLSGIAQPVRYQTKLLEQLANRVNLHPNGTSIRNIYTEVGSFCGHPLVIATDSSGTITHLGMKLFGIQMDRTVLPRMQRTVFDFLERYTLDLLSQDEMTVEKKLHFDKVLFRKGKPENLLHIADSMLFSLSFHDKYYEVSWTDNGIPLVTIAFPAQYELLTGMPVAEIQKSVKEAIHNSRPRIIAKETPPHMELLDNGIYASKHEIYQIENISDATYYHKEGEDFLPIFNEEQKAYSLANLMLGLISEIDYRVYLEQSVYGMQSIHYIISLQEWLNFLAEQEMKVFCGLEEQREDGLMMLIVAQNKQLGYNHQLSIIIPDAFIKSHNVVLKGRLSAYIPIHNLKNLYSEYPSIKKN